MKKRILAMVLAMVMVCALLPTAALAADLPKLATPTDLQWGVHYVYTWSGDNDEEELQETVTLPGSMGWQITGDCQNRFQVSIYTADGNCVRNGSWSMATDTTRTYFDVDDFIWDSAELDSGDYYFTVQALGDGNNYANSDEARSGTWTYNKPSGKLEAPSRPAWEDETESERIGGKFDDTNTTENVYAHGVETFFSKTNGSATDADIEDLELAGGEWWEDYSNYLTFVLDDETLASYGPGYYYVRARTLSKDITSYQNSDWSPLSTAYHFEGVYDAVNKELGEIADDANAATIREAVQGIENLHAALAADQGDEDGVAAKLDALETQAGITKTVAVAEGLGDTFAAEDVKFVGAALNDLAENATEVKLNVAPLAEETNLVIPTLYNDTVVTKFSMDVEGVSDTSDLKVPILITLPVPSHINPDFLVILHYDSQGVPTTIDFPRIYQEGQKWMVSFVVDHFSDFVMTETKQPTVLTKSMFTVDTADVTHTGSPISKTITSDLVLDTDYTVAYQNNTAVGTATITITGKGDYTGTLTYTFTIKSASGGSTGGGTGSSGGSTGGGTSSSGGSSSGGGSATPAKPVEPETPVEPENPVEPETPATPASEVYRDVEKDSWYEAGVTFVTNKGLFQGVSEGVFAPADNMTRAMLMTVLARLDGQETAGGDTWYAKGMDWAKEQGISDGTAPESNVSREQLVVMLYRYAKTPETEGDLTAFADGSDVSDWAKAAMTWATSQSILTGKQDARLDPQGTATRAEVATIIQRFMEKMEK